MVCGLLHLSIASTLHLSGSGHQLPSSPTSCGPGLTGLSLPASVDRGFGGSVEGT